MIMYIMLIMISQNEGEWLMIIERAVGKVGLVCYEPIKCKLSIILIFTKVVAPICFHKGCRLCCFVVLRSRISEFGTLNHYFECNYSAINTFEFTV